MRAKETNSDLIHKSSRRTAELCRCPNPVALVFLLLSTFSTQTTGQVAKTNWRDLSPHETHFAVVNGVTLHYLDWGGRGEALLFLAGLGNTAHIFDDLAPRFTCCFHVLGFTRRGFGLSDKPATGYDVASRVADLVGLLNQLHIKRVNLVGHSIAGDELIEFAVRHPDRVGSLVFLDATYDHSTMPVAAANAISEAASRNFDSAQAVSSLETFTVYQKHLLGRAWAEPWEADIRDAYLIRPDNTIEPRNSADAIAALRKGSREAYPDFSHISARALAIVAISDPMEGLNLKDRTKYQLYADEITNWKAEQLRILHKNGSNVRVVIMDQTDHYCFLQRPDRVTKEMMIFLNCNLSKSGP
jgi:pimeloyl-ACP methyl ester carboxylesterase